MCGLWSEGGSEVSQLCLLSEEVEEGGYEEGLTRELILEILVVFVAIFVGSNEGARFGVAHVLQLVGVFFDANFA